MNVELMPRASRQEGFRREPLPLPPGNTFRRCLTAEVVGAYRSVPPELVAAEFWPSDRIVAQMLTRAASAPAFTTVAGWAAELIQLKIMDALAAMGPTAAAQQVLRASTVLNFDNAGIISAPGFVASAANAGFVAEGQPIPVRQLAVSPAQLPPYKLAAIAVLTEEMLLSSNAEQLISDTLLRSTSAALDAALFGNAAGSAASPPGLRYNITPLTASAVTSPWDAYFADAAALIDAISPVAGNGPYYLIASPGRATQMRLRALGEEGEPFYILGSSAIPSNQVVAIGPAALVAAIAPEAEIELANSTSLHMDSVPSQIVNAGTMANHVQSMFQTASVALRMRWRISWALRDPRGVAWLTPTAW
jgi:Phage capsid family